ncbi:MAG: hypothetical protein U0M15_03445 [Bacillota bacterium]|nr:hypothetical protein [Bacillota bacterium]
MKQTISTNDFKNMFMKRPFGILVMDKKSCCKSCCKNIGGRAFF